MLVGVALGACKGGVTAAELLDSAGWGAPEFAVAVAMLAASLVTGTAVRPASASPLGPGASELQALSATQLKPK
jgi:hypothetical protein